MRRKGQKGRRKTKRKWAKSFQKEVISEVNHPREFQAKMRAGSQSHQSMS